MKSAIYCLDAALPKPTQTHNYIHLGGENLDR